MVCILLLLYSRNKSAVYVADLAKYCIVNTLTKEKAEFKKYKPLDLFYHKSLMMN